MVKRLERKSQELNIDAWRAMWMLSEKHIPQSIENIFFEISMHFTLFMMRPACRVVFKVDVVQCFVLEKRNGSNSIQNQSNFKTVVIIGLGLDFNSHLLET